jgi:hypothetical protein
MRMMTRWKWWLERLLWPDRRPGCGLPFNPWFSPAGSRRLLLAVLQCNRADHCPQGEVSLQSIDPWRLW